MRVLITGGGTGGHVYPALAVVERMSSAEREGVAWVGSYDGMERDIVAREGIRYLAVRAGAVRGAGPLRALRSAVSLAQGVIEAQRVLRSFGADVVLSTGGFVSAPLVVAAWLRRCPCLVYLPDIEPGLAVRFQSRWADRVAVSFEEAAGYFRRDKVVVTGYPVRAELYAWDRARARASLGLAQTLPLVLVMGGSRAAHSINMAVQATMRELLSVAQVLHLCGQDDLAGLEQSAAALPSPARERYHPYAYLHEEMPAALAAADLVVARAGAATLAEFPAVGLPAILVPYPYSGQHQEANARYLVERGAAVMVRDADLKEQLLPTLLTLLNDEPRRIAMAAASRRLAHPDAATAILSVLADLVAARTSGLRASRPTRQERGDGR